MQLRLLLVSLILVAAINAACSDDGDDERQDSDSPPPMDDAMPTGDGDMPVISARTYVSGSAKVTVSGSFQINNDIPLNIQASISDGEMTWLQYGASGSEAPNALVTVSPYEVGLNVGRGRPTATAGNDICTGGMIVTGNSVSGHYECEDVTSYDPGNGQMATVNIEIDFTAVS
jgi:hypothetical protein